MKYKIIKKINYENEIHEKQIYIDNMIKYIIEKMSTLGCQDSNNEDDEVSIVFSIGGDGTMMHTINSFVHKDPVFIGINAGNVGFLTAYNCEDVYNDQLFDSIMNKPRIETRSLVECLYKNHSYTATNEISLNPDEINQVVEFSVEIENNHDNIFRRAGTYKANTLLLSTPMGSSAYNKNAGGAIVDHNMNSVQFTLVASMYSGTHPVLFNENSLLKIIAEKPFNIYVDGIRKEKIEKGDFIYVKVHNKKARILLPDSWNQFHVMAKKLHWNNGNEF